MIFSLLVSACATEYKKSLERLPDGFVIPDEYLGVLSYDSEKKNLILRGDMSLEEYEDLLDLSDDQSYQKAITSLFEWSYQDETLTEGLLSISVQQDLMPVMQKVIEKFKKKYSKVNLIVYTQPSSALCLNDILEKNVRLALMYLNPEDGSFNGKTMPGKKIKTFERVVLRDAACFIAYPECKQHELTSKEISDILTGKTTSWNAVQGENVDISVFLKKGSYKKVIEDSLKIQISKDLPFITFCDTEKEVLKNVKKVRGALGIVGLSSLRYALTVSKENRDTTSFKAIGVATKEEGPFYQPYQAFVYQKKYPFVVDASVVAVSNAGRLPLAFSSFTSNGANGQSIFMSEGFVPMNQKIKIVKKLK